VLGYILIILGAACFGQGAMLAGAKPGFDWILVGVVMGACGFIEAMERKR
jgi:hypothetical protein